MQEEALPHRAVQFAGQRELAPGFDAHRHGRKAGLVGEGDRRCEDGAPVVVAIKRLDQLGVDLDRVDWKVPREAEGGLTRAHVVERDRDAQTLYVGERLAGALGVAHDRLLTHLQAQCPPGQPAVRELLAHALGEIELTQLARGDVDGDRDRDPFAPPSLGLGAGRV
jgi:hypothetical protein